MVARWFPVGLLLVLSVSATLGLSTAQAAYPAGSAFTVQHRSPQFRPLSRADVGANAVQRQSRVLSPTRGGDHRRQQPVFSDDRAGARKAVPITRGQELGLRFRPDERASPYGQSVMPHDGGAADRYSEQLHSQFRPAPRRTTPRSSTTFPAGSNSTASAPSPRPPAARSSTRRPARALAAPTPMACAWWPRTARAAPVTWRTRPGPSPRLPS